MFFEILCPCGAQKENLCKDYCLSCEILDLLNPRKKQTSFSCHKCGKTYNNATSRNRHLQSHDTHKRFKCFYKKCDFSCTDRTKLKLHLYTHTGVKMFKCDECGKGCSTPYNLKTHRRTVHGFDK